MTNVPSEPQVVVPVAPLDDGLSTGLVTPSPLDVDTQLERFLKLAVAQAGDAYDPKSLEGDPNDPDPDALDCSELVQWAAHMSGVEITDGSVYQHFQLIDRGGTVSIDDALNTPGALLFSFDPPPVPGGGRPAHAHVAISLGDGRTIEAMSTSRGIAIANPDPSRWTNAAVIPELRVQEVDIDDVMSWVGRDAEVPSLLGIAVETPVEPPAETVTLPPVVDPLAEAALNVNSVDTDVDMLPDHYEIKYGLDPNEADTDGDGITDGYELIVLGTEPDLADSDFDGISDGLELSLGLDPTVADNPDLDAPLVAPDDLLFDSDGDGITDWGEEMAGTDAGDPDTDDDGVLDGDELMLDTNPLSADL